MGKRLRRAAVVLVALLGGVAGATVIAQPAFAAACSGSSCVHVDPNWAGCSSGATSIASVRPAGGGPRIFLRWSATCVANWARWDDGNSESPGNWDYWVETTDGHKEYKLFNGAYWTYMVNGNMLARACIDDIWAPPTCTNWY